MNYVLYHEDGGISDFSGAFQVNGNGTWSAIGTNEPLKIPINGYLSIFLSNWETMECNCSGSTYEGDVYFDLLRVRFMQGQVKEETHYYPHGLPMGDSEASAHGFVQNRHKHQGNEYIREVGLNWMDFHARQYDPQIGRFLGVDPLADVSVQDRFSPYAAMGNNPVKYSDPSGLLFDEQRDNNVNILDPYELLRSFAPSSMNFIIGMDGTDFNVTFRPAPLKLTEELVEFILEVLSNMEDGVYNMKIGVEGEDIILTVGVIGAGSEGFESVQTTDQESSGGGVGMVRIIADAISGNQVSKMEASLELLETEGYKSYLYSQVGNARSDIMFSMLGQFKGGKGGGSVTKGGSKLFGKEAVTTTTRIGRDGKAVEVIFKDRSKIDINATRVKQWTPNTHPNAPAGTLQKVKFENSLPGSKGYKRTPTQSELDFLNGL